MKPRIILINTLVLTAAFVFGKGSLADSVPGDNGPIEITPLIHSSVQLEYAGKVIQVDPWDPRGGLQAKAADLILVTDSPGHHLDVAAIENLRKPDAPVVIPANSKERLADGIVVANGETIEVAGVTVEAVAAYDIIQGPPAHPKGDANGYVVTLGGKRLFFAGVTECVEEVIDLRDIAVAFLPMNIPPNRMTPEAAAECARIIDPDVVYLYHYDQDYARRAVNPDSEQAGLPGGLTIAQSLQAFANAMRGSGVEVRMGNFYPPLD